MGIARFIILFVYDGLFSMVDGINIIYDNFESCLVSALQIIIACANITM